MVDDLKNKNQKKSSFFSSIFNSIFFVTEDEKDYFIENLSMLLASGMDIFMVLDAIEKGIHSGAMRSIISKIKEEIDAGFPLWKALKNSKLLPDHVLVLFKIGEESGSLQENLKVINKQQRKERVFRSKLRSAMMYPVFVFCLTVIIGVGIAWFILPRLSSVFSSLKLSLPTITKVLIAVGDFLGEYGIIVVPLFFLVLLFMVYFVFIYKKTKHLGQSILLHFPVLSTLIKEVELSQMGFILGNLLRVGLPVDKALSSLETTTEIRVYQHFYEKIRKSIEEGNSFRKTFAKNPFMKEYIPPPVQQMIVSGEQSANLSDTLLKMGENFDEKTEITTKNLTVLFEPVLLLIVWGGVMAVALAVILPIYSLVGGFTSSQRVQSARPVVQSKVVLEPIVVQSEIVVVSKLMVSKDITKLNVRNEPKGRLVGAVFPGEVYVYENSKDGWHEIVLNDGGRGWVSGEYIEILATEEETTTKSDLDLTTVSSEKKIEGPNLEILPTGIGYLNVRNNGQIVGTVKPGEIYSYTNFENGWYEISFKEGKSGWVVAKYIKKLDDATE
ncbi:type II secretion system F family protein [Candidatus Gracilibacteria bacterium]|nr:type II secretion system F family protein [Candidatus Gracilibacteria bacterium]